MSVGTGQYLEYRDSGLPWLGEIPAHWEVRRNGRLFAERREAADPELPLLEVSIRTGVRVRQLGDGGRKQAMADRSKYQRARAGDIAYNMMRMWQGAVGVVPTDGLVSPAYVVARPYEDVEPRYYAYLFRTAAYLQQVAIESRGIVPDRNRLYWDAFKAMPSVYPPLQEQRQIAGYLDSQSHKLRRFETTKQGVRATLHQYLLRSVMCRITSGDPSQTGRRGPEWTGEIPAHWDVVALRHRYEVQLGKMLDAKQITGHALVPYLRNVDVQWDRVNADDLPHMDIAPGEYDRYTLRQGDLLVCEGGEVGRAAFWDGTLELCGFQKALHRVRVLDPERDNPRFLFYLLFAAAKLGVFLAGGKENTIAHLTRDALRATRFPFPPKAEQDAIVAALDAERRELKRLESKIDDELRLMREYSQHLTTLAVTGGIDVRNASLELPELEAAFTDEGDRSDDVAEDAEVAAVTDDAD